MTCAAWFRLRDWTHGSGTRKTEEFLRRDKVSHPQGQGGQAGRVEAQQKPYRESQTSLSSGDGDATAVVTAGLLETMGAMPSLAGDWTHMIDKGRAPPRFPAQKPSLFPLSSGQI